jgi:mannose-6-phosphate isomerase-like protein (cupin superfamily)
LTRFDRGQVSLGRFATRTPWEKHPEGDELLYVLDGRIDVVLLSRARPVRVPVHAGSIFLVPKGVWHRQVPRPVASVLSALPTAHGPISWEEDPRRKPAKKATRPRRR